MDDVVRSIWDAAWDDIEARYGPVLARAREKQARADMRVCEEHEHEFKEEQ